MRVPAKLRDNAHYFGLIQRSIVELFTMPDQKIILKKLKTKLSTESYELLTKFGVLLATRKWIKSVQADASNATGIAGDRSVFIAATQSAQECEAQITRVVEDIRPIIFLIFAAELTTSLALVVVNIP